MLEYITALQRSLIFSILSLYGIVVFNITQINTLRQRMQCYLHSHQVNLM